MPDSFRIVIPTRNGGGWLAAFARAYARLGVRPLYVLDARTSDDSRDILAQFGCDVIEVTADFDRGEDVLWRGAIQADARWLLRIDDDEMPSRALIDWMAHALPERPEPALYVSCRQAWHGGYSRLEDLYFNHARPDFLMPQPRLFRPDRVRYVTDLHTPGIDPAGAGWAPPDLFFLHFDWLVRDLPTRWAKLRGYEAQISGGGRDFVAFSIPEVQDVARLRITKLETDEFEPLLADLRDTLKS
jgi:hypothetical protein